MYSDIQCPNCSIFSLTSHPTFLHKSLSHRLCFIFPSYVETDFRLSSNFSGLYLFVPRWTWWLWRIDLRTSTFNISLISSKKRVLPILISLNSWVVKLLNEILLTMLTIEQSHGVGWPSVLVGEEEEFMGERIGDLGESHESFGCLDGLLGLK